MTTKKQSVDKQEEAPKKEAKKLTASQAWNAISGNTRLMTFVRKKYKGLKTYDEWKTTFTDDNLK